MSAPVVQATGVAVSYGENVALEGVDLTPGRVAWCTG